MCRLGARRSHRQCYGQNVKGLTFRDVSAVRDIACREFSRIEAIIKELLPDSGVEHVGSTALPQGITKGDLDIQVRVGSQMFEAARAVIGLEFVPDPDNVRGDGETSFKIDGADIPIAIHLTEIAGEFEFQWKYRDLLRNRPDLVLEYDDIKRCFAGKRMSDYRKAKAEFFDRIRHLSPRASQIDPHRVTRQVLLTNRNARRFVRAHRAARSSRPGMKHPDRPCGELLLMTAGAICR